MSLIIREIISPGGVILKRISGIIFVLAMIFSVSGFAEDQGTAGKEVKADKVVQTVVPKTAPMSQKQLNCKKKCRKACCAKKATMKKDCPMAANCRENCKKACCSKKAAMKKDCPKAVNCKSNCKKARCANKAVMAKDCPKTMKCKKGCRKKCCAGKAPAEVPAKSVASKAVPATHI